MVIDCPRPGTLRHTGLDHRFQSRYPLIHSAPQATLYCHEDTVALCSKPESCRQTRGDLPLVQTPQAGRTLLGQCNMKMITDEIANAILDSKSNVFLTGAGISTESGVPDYRSSNNQFWGEYDLRVKKYRLIFFIYT